MSSYDHTLQAHQALHALPADDDVVRFQFSLDASGAVEGKPRVDFINAAHDADVFLVYDRRVVNACAGDVQKRGLAGNTDIGMSAVNEIEAFPRYSSFESFP